MQLYTDPADAQMAVARVRAYQPAFVARKFKRRVRADGQSMAVWVVVVRRRPGALAGVLPFAAGGEP